MPHLHKDFTGNCYKYYMAAYAYYVNEIIYDDLNKNRKGNAEKYIQIAQKNKGKKTSRNIDVAKWVDFLK